jgi:hypothetical protein
VGGNRAQAIKLGSANHLKKYNVERFKAAGRQSKAGGIGRPRAEHIQA